MPSRKPECQTNSSEKSASSPSTSRPEAGRSATARSCLIQQNTALFSLLGTYYGGDGRSNFALPNLQGSVPLHVGGSQPGPGLSTYYLGQSGGETTVTLLQSELPAHTHALQGSTTAAAATTPAGNVVLAAPPSSPRHPSALYKTGAVTTPVPLDPSVLAPAGGGGPHNNLQPYLTLNFIIALTGIFPPRP